MFLPDTTWWTTDAEVEAVCAEFGKVVNDGGGEA